MCQETGKMKVRLEICYTDGEKVNKEFEALKQCLDYLNAEIIEKDEFVDEIRIYSK